MELGWGPAQYTYQQVLGHEGVELPVGNQGQHQGHAITDDLCRETVQGWLCPSSQRGPHYSTCSLGHHPFLCPQAPGIRLGVIETKVPLRKV